MRDQLEQIFENFLETTHDAMIKDLECQLEDKELYNKENMEDYE